MVSSHDLLRRVTSGVYVVTSSHQGTSNGFTAAWVIQVSFEPLLVAVSINPGNVTWQLIENSRRFVVNVLDSDQKALARHFGLQSGRDVDKFAGVHTGNPDGTPFLADALAWLDCIVEQQVTAGDHIVVLARVIGGDVLDPNGTPMRYSETGNMDGSADLDR
jgi:flavin reductase (DIM6/NTAB) family NADH-FMN oxidoreductase RutF